MYKEYISNYNDFLQQLWIQCCSFTSLHEVSVILMYQFNAFFAANTQHTMHNVWYEIRMKRASARY